VLSKIVKFLHLRVARHILFWVSYVLFFGFIYGKYDDNYTWYFLESVCMLPFIMTVTYLVIYTYLPSLLKRRKVVLNIFLLSATLFLATLGERIALRLLNSLPVNFNSLFDVPFFYLFLETSFMVGCAIAIKLVKEWFGQQQEKHQIEKQNLENELNLLKSQLNPHFLFNAMNNLYTLSLKKSPKTSEGIAIISDLLRLVLYEFNEPETDLGKEVKVIRDFIELEKMRYSGCLDLSFDVAGEIEGYRIAPMLLFTFVENCFKHVGCSNCECPWIRIMIQTNGKKIVFNAENSTVKTVASANNNSGIGLKNVKKRLELLYKDFYHLEVENKNEVFKVALELERQ